VSDAVGGPTALPASLRPLLEEAQQAYDMWAESQDDAFGEGDAADAAASMARALRSFTAGAADAGMDTSEVATILRRKFPEAPTRVVPGWDSRDTTAPRQTTRHRAPAEAIRKDAEILSTPLGRRYADAYAVARTIVGLGGTVKVLAYVVGGLVAFAVIVEAVQGGAGSQLVTTSLVLAGSAAAIAIYVLGVLVTAVGQILRATLDTAVNTSPLLAKDDVRRIMSVD
jgi:hypothetical protein